MDTSLCPINNWAGTAVISLFLFLEAKLLSPPIRCYQFNTLNGPHRTDPEPAMWHKPQKVDEHLQEIKYVFFFCQKSIHTTEGITCLHNPLALASNSIQLNHHMLKGRHGYCPAKGTKAVRASSLSEIRFFESHKGRPFLIINTGENQEGDSRALLLDNEGSTTHQFSPKMKSLRLEVVTHGLGDTCASQDTSQDLGGRGMWIPGMSRPSWSTEKVPG